jgi:hypothetical protein
MRPDDDLDPQERDFLVRIAEPLRRPVPLSSRVERVVLARIRTGAGPMPGPSRGRLWTAAAAAGIAAVFALGVLVGRRTVPTVATDRLPRTVEFVLRTSADSGVALVGDFNDWDPRATPLHADRDGVWTVTVPLRPGRYRYTFLVDGTWRGDPAAPRSLEDDFGRPTSVITIAQL